MAYKDETAGIPLENIYNMDETGFGIGTEQSTRVIINQEVLNTRYKTSPGRQEWVSVVECVCADGTAIPPFLIFTGVSGVNTNLLTDNIPKDWCFGVSTKGWTSNIYSLE